MCRMRGGCTGGYCVNPDQCNCIGCPRSFLNVESCDPSFCAEACHANGCDFSECTNSVCQCDCRVKECNQPACMASCQSRGYKQGMCGPTGDCQCAFPNTTILVVDNGVPCSLTDRTYCDNVCNAFGCNVGNCSIDGQRESCHCSECHSGCDMKMKKSTSLAIVGKSQVSCQVGGRAACVASCKVQGCETGYCEGTAPNEVCVCSRCSSNVTTTALAVVDRTETPCLIGKTYSCHLSCQAHGCTGGRCNNETCACTGCSKTEQMSGLVVVGNTRVSCQVGGRAACVASCKVQGCETGYCEGTAPNEVCVCSRCSPTRNSSSTALALIVINNPAVSCQVGGRAACVASCKVQGCETGYCEGTAPNEVCVCSRCSHKMIEHYNKTKVATF